MVPLPPTGTGAPGGAGPWTRLLLPALVNGSLPALPTVYVATGSARAVLAAAAAVVLLIAAVIAGSVARQAKRLRRSCRDRVTPKLQCGPK